MSLDNFLSLLFPTFISLVYTLFVVPPSFPSSKLIPQVKQLLKMVVTKGEKIQALNSEKGKEMMKIMKETAEAFGKKKVRTKKNATKQNDQKKTWKRTKPLAFKKDVICPNLVI
ncbi:hypothetical protein V2J09_010901 [Rumex salicifolius]